jgi:glycosyltransferase involved in cell wall biosynthesis
MKSPPIDVDHLKDRKIVILVSAFGGEGSQRQAYLLAREWRQRYNLDVEVWALWEGKHTKQFEIAGIPTRALYFTRPRCPVRWVRGIYWARRLFRVVRQLKERRIDVILPFGGWPNVVAAFTYRWAGIKVCIWGERPMGRARGERLAVRLCRRFIANSSSGVEYLSAHLQVPVERIVLIPNAVEEADTTPQMDMKTKLGLKPEQPLVVKVAAMDVSRDHETVLRAWKIVQDLWPGSEKPVLALAGTFGDTQGECRKIVHKEGLDSTVRFLGMIQNVSDLIASSDVAVFSTKTPAMSNAVLECMIAGKPVVASDVAGVRDTLGSYAGEVLVPPGDADAFARAIVALLQDVEKRKAIGEANRARAQSEFSIDRFAENYLRVVGEYLPRTGTGNSNAIAAPERQARHVS